MVVSRRSFPCLGPNLQPVENLSKVLLIQFNAVGFLHSSTDTPGQVHQRAQGFSGFIFLKRLVTLGKVKSEQQVANPSVSPLRAWYAASIAGFLQTSADAIFGHLAKNSDFDITPTQRNAWIEQIEFLQAKLQQLTGQLFLEFNIPRMGRRIDVVLLIGPIVFVVEFKVGEEQFDRAAIEQVWDYALDLKNFHEASHHASLIPILIATKSKATPTVEFTADSDCVYRPIRVTPESFRAAIDSALQKITGGELDMNQWAQAP